MHRIIKWSESYLRIGLLCTTLSFILATAIVAQPLSSASKWFPTTALSSAIAGRDAIIHHQFVYLIGGKDGSGNPVTDVYRAQIVSGVTLGDWVPISHLPYPLHSLAAVATDKYIYVIGGWDGSNAHAEVLRAEFTSNGLGPWSTINNLQTRIQVHSAVILNNSLIYVLGGTDNNAVPLKTVYYTQIQADGSLGSWQPTINLPNALSRLSAAAYNNFIYIIGGYDGKNARNQIYRAHVSSNGHLEGWIEEKSAHPSSRYYSEVVARNGELIIMGGTDGTNTFNETWSTLIDPNGSLGDWKTQNPLLEPRYRFAAVLGDLGQIYAIGGLDSSNNYRNDVYVLADPPTATCSISAMPFGWLPPGKSATYTVACQAGRQWPVKNLVVTHALPQEVKLIPGSGNGCTIDSQPITCTFSQLAPGQMASKSYQVRRPANAASTPAPSASGLQITKSGDYVVEPGQPIHYTLVVTNSNAAKAKGPFILTDQLPIGQVITKEITATTTGQLGQGQEITHALQPDPEPTTPAPQSYTITWRIPVTLAQNDVITAKIAIIPPTQTTTNANYRVQSADGVYTATGSIPVITYAGPTKDGLIIKSTLTWTFASQTASQSQAFVLNSPFTIYLPLIRD